MPQQAQKKAERKTFTPRDGGHKAAADKKTTAAAVTDQNKKTTGESHAD